MDLEKMAMENNKKAEMSLSKYACKTSQAIRLKVENRKNEFNVRPAFFRDIDRILHSTAYTRYMDKTQVFSLFKNDLLTHRGLHVQFVSKIARTIGKILLLNEDLIEAMALGHDLGHVPFGHTGERILNDICGKNNLGLFLHNAQSVRILKEIENSGKGLNLTIQVLDGILCHNGEILNRRYEPMYDKTMEQFLEEYEKCFIEEGFDKRIRPMTLEGCVVRVSDVIAYIGRDIEDAIVVGLIKREDIPEDITSILGDTNSKIIDSLVSDVLENSLNKPYIELSKEKYNALNKLLEFNYKNIYSNPKKEEPKEKIENLFKSLFEKYAEDLENKIGDIYFMHSKNMNDDYTNNNLSGRIIIDFIAGMTDKFFIDQYKKNFLPREFEMKVE